MTGQAMASMGIFLVVFAAIAAAAYWRSRLNADERRAVSRMHENLAPAKNSTVAIHDWWDRLLQALPKLGAAAGATDASSLQARLRRAGVYSKQAPAAFRGAKIVLLVTLPLLVVGLPSLLGMLPSHFAMFAVGVAGGFGLIAPELWLRKRMKQRQIALRRGLPDALDMIVLCLEGGISLIAAIQRVSSEIRTAHPVLASEMDVLQREVQLGMSAGEAMQKFAVRSNVEEIKHLASVLMQSERYGASVVKPLRLHAELGRQERHQRAEERAQQAAVKILFPTLLCIFPAIFIVILGPAAYQVAQIFGK